MATDLTLSLDQTLPASLRMSLQPLLQYLVSGHSTSWDYDVNRVTVNITFDLDRQNSPRSNDDRPTEQDPSDPHTLPQNLQLPIPSTPEPSQAPRPDFHPNDNRRPVNVGISAITRLTPVATVKPNQETSVRSPLVYRIKRIPLARPTRGTADRDLYSFNRVPTTRAPSPANQPADMSHVTNTTHAPTPTTMTTSHPSHHQHPVFNQQINAQSGRWHHISNPVFPTNPQSQTDCAFTTHVDIKPNVEDLRMSIPHDRHSDYELIRELYFHPQ